MVERSRSKLPYLDSARRALMQSNGVTVARVALFSVALAVNLPFLSGDAPTIVHIDWMRTPVTDASVRSFIEQGDVAGLKQSLPTDYDLNRVHDDVPTTPLIWSALHNQIDVAKFLIQRGADVNSQGEMGGTAMHAAAFFGRPQIVQLLIDRGADVTMKNNFGNRPITELTIDWQTTQLVADRMNVELDESALDNGRRQVLAMIMKRQALSGPAVRDPNPLSVVLASSSGQMLPKLFIALIACVALAGCMIAVRWRNLDLG